MKPTPVWWRRMTAATLRADIPAGFLGAILALPQGIAFATLAGLPPEYGIYTAIVPCIVAAAFGSSWHVVSGPTNATSLALFAALSPLGLVGSPDYIALALVLTIMVGVMQLALGGLKLGWVTDFIAPAVLVGFTSGAAALIALYAMQNLLGLDLPNSHGPFDVISGLAANLGHFNPSALAIGAITLAVTILTARVAPRLPYMLIGLVAGFALSEFLATQSFWPSIERIGTIPSVLPRFSIPHVPLDILPDLVAIAGSLAIVALGQSVSIAKAMAQRSGQHLNVDREFIGQGLSNIVGGLFSSYLSSGSLNRSYPNLKAGARTPLAAILSALFLIGLAFATRPVLERIPLPAIAAMLLYVAWSLFDGRQFMRLARLSRADFGIALATLAGMFLLPVQYAILLGSSLSLLIYLHRTAHPGIRPLVPDPASPSRAFTPLDELTNPPPECPQLKLVRIEGSIYFGAAGYAADRLHRMRSGTTQKHLLVMAKSMNFIDLAGADLWDHELLQRRAMGGDLYFHRPRNAVRQLWEKTGFDQRLGAANLFQSKTEAIAEIYKRLDPAICENCTSMVFLECRKARALKSEGATTPKVAD